MKISEIAANWDRVKVSLGAASRPQRPFDIGPLKDASWDRSRMKSLEIYES